MIVITGLLCTSSPLRAQTRWQIDSARSAVRFSIPFMILSTVRGTFGRIVGTITTSAERPDDVRIDAAIDAASVDTRDRERDRDLKGPTGLDVDRFPQVIFRSTATRRVSPGHMLVGGDLTIRGITRAVDLIVESAGTAPVAWSGETRIVAHANAEVHWRDYGMRFNRLVGDKLLLMLHVELTRS